MKTEALIPDDFFKQFKTGEDLNNFLKSLQKRGIEKMLEGELDAHLDYPKHESRKDTNSKYLKIHRLYSFKMCTTERLPQMIPC